MSIVIAGAGLWGCTLARRFAEQGNKVLCIEKRAFPGGNVRCETDEETGIEIHSYGSHIFHTHIPRVWDFINRFTKFNGYQHKVIASYCGKTYFLPVGLALINKFFNVELLPGQVEEFMKDEAHSRALFDAFFRGYTSKQWGVPAESVDPSIIKRVPVRTNYDVNYFNDYNQGIPLDGYNAIFDRLLNHELIELKCNAPLRLEGGRFFAGADELPKDAKIFYSGPIDALFGYCYGALPWRTLSFETEKLQVRDFQGSAVVNYTNEDIPYTRVHEFKHYHPENKDIMNIGKTIITREYSKKWKLGDEPYYPVNSEDSRQLYAKYQEELKKYPNLVVGGRLGAYKYYDMDQSIEDALSL